MNRSLIVLILSLLTLAACGGADDSVGNSNPPPSPAIGINPDNVLVVAQVTYQSAASSGEIADLASDTGVTGAGVGNLTKPAIVQPGILDAVLQTPFGPTELSCAMSGTLTVSGDLADLLTLSAGDTITVEYDACDDGVGEVLDGRLDLEINSVSGDVATGLYELTMTILLTDFQSATASDVLTGNGDGTATVNTLAAPYVEASVFGNSMRTDSNASSETLTNFSSAQTLDAGISPAPFTFLVSGTLDSSQLGGSVEYSTQVIFEGFDTNYPYVGELLIVGDTSSARIIAQANAIDVVIELYSNTTGTGTPDSTINTTWTELAGL